MSSNTEVTRTGYGLKNLGIILFILRLALGGLMFEAGLNKLVGGFSATGFLSHSTGPLAGFYSGLVSYVDIINVLVPWAELLIGLALILGLLVRLASFWGAIEVFIFYLAVLPPAQGWINYQIVLVAVFLTFMFSGTGYYLGLDYFARGLEEKRHWLRNIFG